MTVTTTHTTDRYPGWTFEKTIERDGRETWFGTKKGLGYAVHSSQKPSSGKIYGELMTMQTGLTGTKSWEPIKSSRKPFAGEMSECIAEAERRAAYWKAKESNK